MVNWRIIVTILNLEIEELIALMHQEDERILLQFERLTAFPKQFESPLTQLGQVVDRAVRANECRRWAASGNEQKGLVCRRELESQTLLEAGDFLGIA